MQPVSQAWLNNQKMPVVSKGYLRIELYVSNNDIYLPETTITGAQTDATYSNYENIIKEEKVVKPQSFLGLNQFVLDGNTDIIEANTEGVYSAYLSRYNGALTTFSVTITLPYETSNKTRSIQLQFDENRGYAVDFKVTFRKPVSGGWLIIHRETITNNTESVVNLNFEDIVGYSEIVIEVSKWSLPFQKAFISYIFLGFVKTFTEKDIISYTAKNSIDLTNGNLPTDEINFEIDNTEGVFDSDPNNTSSKNIYGFLSTRQKIVVSYGYKFNNLTEWIKGGTVYLSEWNCPQNGITASFTAKNILSFLSMNFVKNNNDTLTYKNLAIAVFNASGVVKYNLQDSKLSGTINASINNVTCAEVLQQIAQATSSILYCDRDGTIRIEAIPSVIYGNYNIDLENCYKYPEIYLEEEVKNLTVWFYAYSQTSSGGDVIETITKTSTTYSNYYQGNEMEINNPLVKDVYDYSNYFNIKNRRINYSCVLRIDPRVELLDIVTLTSKNNDTSYVIVTGTTIDYNGAFSGKVEVKIWQ